MPESLHELGLLGCSCYIKSHLQLDGGKLYTAKMYGQYINNDGLTKGWEWGEEDKMTERYKFMFRTVEQAIDVVYKNNQYTQTYHSCSSCKLVGAITPRADVELKCVVCSAPMVKDDRHFSLLKMDERFRIHKCGRCLSFHFVDCDGRRERDEKLWNERQEAEPRALAAFKAAGGKEPAGCVGVSGHPGYAGPDDCPYCKAIRPRHHTAVGWVDWDTSYLSILGKAMNLEDELRYCCSKLQLMAEWQTSRTAGLKSVGLDYKEQVRQQMEEQAFQAQLQEELEKNMKVSMSCTSTPSDSIEISPELAEKLKEPVAEKDMCSLKEANKKYASEWLGADYDPAKDPDPLSSGFAVGVMSLSNTDRVMRMVQLKRENPDLYTRVKAKLAVMKEKAK